MKHVLYKIPLFIPCLFLHGHQSCLCYTKFDFFSSYVGLFIPSVSIHLSPPWSSPSSLLQYPLSKWREHLHVHGCLSSTDLRRLLFHHTRPDASMSFLNTSLWLWMADCLWPCRECTSDPLCLLPTNTAAASVQAHLATHIDRRTRVNTHTKSPWYTQGHRSDHAELRSSFLAYLFFHLLFSSADVTSARQMCSKCAHRSAAGRRMFCIPPVEHVRSSCGPSICMH